MCESECVYVKGRFLSLLRVLNGSDKAKKLTIVFGANHDDHGL